jgi:hypothetical protein
MVVAEKVVDFHDKNKDLSALGQQIEDLLQDDGYKTQINKSAPRRIVIQATKATFCVTLSLLIGPLRY